MEIWQQRTAMLLGEEKVKKLQKFAVIVFGVGGVGGMCAEALVRAGIGKVDLVDFDTIDITNVNRQIIALQNNVGEIKAQEAKKRFLQINPDLDCEIYPIQYGRETMEQIQWDKYDFCVDAIDQVTSKILLVEECQRTNTPMVAAMGAGNKLHPELLEVSFLSKTSICPLARTMRKEIKTRGLKDYKVVYSKEVPQKFDKESGRKPASISFVPPASGLILAGEVVRSLLELE
ncbi:ThiF family adenylyltransferase [Peptoniphilus sp. KCTC 25270]|uniref:tRNA threonylcarbamoyladenosine dehydratase n=1 Tax=Peptoniphilus sp. KCTC 25270 TaxID=2897414 RepID=UPI001E39616F|nr:ThiF family adenylyltransferase [Peptoniphilus sp. KCTC 25270]MCD1147219.1 ThiF family adenylyltransferase [Peptoniphilus sp. KCTC 25270]